MGDAVTRAQANGEVTRELPEVMGWLAGQGGKGDGRGIVTAAEIEGLSPLVLAYIGDAVYELCVRTALAASGGGNVRELHRRAVGVVRAEAQAESLRRLDGFLTEEEEAIVRRGRNAKSGMSPRHASVLEYRHSTGFEALLGFLFLRSELDRLKEIFTRLAEEEAPPT